MSDTAKPVDVRELRELARSFVTRYSIAMDFNDQRFVNVPIDVIESHWELQRIGPLLAGLAEGTTSAENFQKSAEQLHLFLWHLIDHLKDLDVALKSYDETL